MSTEDPRLYDLLQSLLESDLAEVQAFGAGDDLEDMLEEVEELVSLAHQLQALGQRTMPNASAALARSRERVLHALPEPLSTSASQSLAPVSRGAWPWSWTSAMRWAPVMAVFVLSFLIFMALTVSASARAMPDSPLYPVKRTAEALTLKLAPPSRRPAIRQAYNQRRAEEIQYAQTHGIQVQTPYEGVVAYCAGQICRIGPFDVVLPPELAAQLRPGDYVRVLIQVQPDESLVALAVEPRVNTPTPWVGEPPAGPIPGAIIPSRATDTPAVVSPPKPRPSTSPRKPAHPTPRPQKTRPSLKRSPSATPRPQKKVATSTSPSLRPSLGTPSPPTATPAKPKPTSPPKTSPAPGGKPRIGTVTPVPRDKRSSSTPRPQVQQRKTLRGSIRRIYRSGNRVVWIILGRNRIYLTSKTVVVGRLAVGRQAVVRTYVRNGRRYASRITVVQPTSGNKATPKSKGDRPRATPRPRTPSGTAPPARRD